MDSCQNVEPESDQASRSKHQFVGNTRNWGTHYIPWRRTLQNQGSGKWYRGKKNLVFLTNRLQGKERDGAENL